MAVKTKQEARCSCSPGRRNGISGQNLVEVVQTRNYMLLLAYFNSTVITVGAVTLLVIFGAMVGYVLQRRPSGWNKVIYACVLIGLMVPPAVVPTIWVLAGAWPVQDDPRDDPDPGRLWSGLLGPSVTAASSRTIPRDAGRGRDHRRREALAGVLPGDPAAAEAGDCHPDRRAVHRHLQRLHQPAVLPAGQGKRHRPADAVQLSEPVPKPVQPVVHEHPSGHDPAPSRVHLLQPPDRRRA